MSSLFNAMPWGGDAVLLGVAFVAGVLFGVGLTVARMIDPSKVLAFLDVAAIADGGWDPSLALVMAAALGVTSIGYAWVFRRPQPRLAPAFALPTRRNVDWRLVVGSVLFGAGWGMAGFCPGPALAALATGNGKAILFVIAMLSGMGCYHVVAARGGVIARRDDKPSA